VNAKRRKRNIRRGQLNEGLCVPRNLSDQDIAVFRDRLCDVAERQFALHGSESVTIRQLASALGVSPMTPYRYFKDKDAILAAVRARAFDRHAEALERAYAAYADGPALRARAILDAYVDFAMHHPEAYKLMFDINQPTEADYPDLVRAGSRSRATMTLHLRDLMREGRVRGDPERIGHMFWAAIHGPLMLHFSGMLSPDQDARSLINALVTALGQSIFAGATAPDPVQASPVTNMEET
jgi:AcrR family transcriptional regulator